MQGRETRTLSLWGTERRERDQGPPETGSDGGTMGRGSHF